MLSKETRCRYFLHLTMLVIDLEGLSLDSAKHRLSFLSK